MWKLSRTTYTRCRLVEGLLLNLVTCVLTANCAPFGLLNHCARGFLVKLSKIGTNAMLEHFQRLVEIL
jgi:hypothetical protein